MSILFIACNLVLALAVVLTFGLACSISYEKGFEAGYNEALLGEIEEKKGGAK